MRRSSYLILTLPAISLSCGCAVKMTLFGFNVVDVLAPVPDVDVITGDVLYTGDDDFTLFVGDGALFACPFLAVTLGFNGRRGINLSRVVE